MNLFHLRIISRLHVDGHGKYQSIDYCNIKQGNINVLIFHLIISLYKRTIGVSIFYSAHLRKTVIPMQADFGCSVRYSIGSPFAEEVWTKSTDIQSGGILRLGPDRCVFAVAMFHQLYCLDGLSKALNSVNQTVLDGHVGHCLNYLRFKPRCSRAKGVHVRSSDNVPIGVLCTIISQLTISRSMNSR